LKTPKEQSEAEEEQTTQWPIEEEQTTQWPIEEEQTTQTRLKIRVNSTRVTRHVILQYILKNQTKKSLILKFYNKLQ
jgi:hypothetical protein